MKHRFIIIGMDDNRSPFFHRKHWHRYGRGRSSPVAYGIRRLSVLCCLPGPNGFHHRTAGACLFPL